MSSNLKNSLGIMQIPETFYDSTGLLSIINETKPLAELVHLLRSWSFSCKLLYQFFICQL